MHFSLCSVAPAISTGRRVSLGNEQRSHSVPGTRHACRAEMPASFRVCGSHKIHPQALAQHNFATVTSTVLSIKKTQNGEQMFLIFINYKSLWGCGLIQFFFNIVFLILKMKISRAISYFFLLFWAPEENFRQLHVSASQVQEVFEKERSKTK